MLKVFSMLNFLSNHKENFTILVYYVINSALLFQVILQNKSL